jgi:uncharacterized protein YmfQ (DUF2313 family)
MQKTLKSLLPPNWKIAGDLKLLVEALAVSFERLRTFLLAVMDEANPGTAEEYLQEWFNQLGMKYDSTQTLSSRRKRARQVYGSTGGQDHAYLQAQVQIRYPDVFIEHQSINSEFMAGSGMAGLMMATDYPSWYPELIPGADDPHFYFRVTGAVNTTADLYGLLNILSRIAPAPFEPILDVTIRSLTSTAASGLAMCGLMEAGRE